MFFSYSQQEQKESWLWKTPTSSEVWGWRLLPLNPTSIHSNSVFQIHREWRRLSKAGAVNFMYRLWNCHRGHVLCSILLQKQVRPFLWWLKVTSERKLFSFIVSISAPSRGVLCTLVRQWATENYSILWTTVNVGSHVGGGEGGGRSQIYVVGGLRYTVIAQLDHLSS